MCEKYLEPVGVDCKIELAFLYFIVGKTENVQPRDYCKVSNDVDMIVHQMRPYRGIGT